MILKGRDKTNERIKEQLLVIKDHIISQKVKNKDLTPIPKTSEESKMPLFSFWNGAIH